MRRLRALGAKETFIADFGVEDGSGNATVTESEVCVHEYGGGFGRGSPSKFSPVRGIGATSSGVGV
jgi:hypothetical protein